MGGDHGQGKFGAICVFIMIDVNVNNTDSYMLEISHIDYDNDKYNILQQSIAIPLNDGNKYMIDGKKIKFPIE